MRKTFLKIKYGIYNATSKCRQAYLFRSEEQATASLDLFMKVSDQKTKENRHKWGVHLLTEKDISKMIKESPSMADVFYNSL